MADEAVLGLPVLAGSLILVILFITWHGDPLLDSIPVMGFSGPLLSYLTALYVHVFDGAQLLKEGYEKTKPGLFRIATLQRWMVVPTSIKLIEDVRKARDDVLDEVKPFNEFTQIDYLLNFLDSEDNYHLGVTRSKLTRNIAATFIEVNDELDPTIRECIPASGEEWIKVSILPTVERILCRTTSRIFVGTPLCRDRDYQTLLMDFRLDFIKAAFIISMFPKPLKPIIARMVANLPSKIRQVEEFIRPLVEDRLTKMEEHGETWDDAPDDMLMWLMSEARGVERSLEGLARRLLLLNVASVNSMTLAVTRVLYHLLAHPEYIEPLRQEVEATVAEEGWTKAGMDKMRKVDSFLRESQRLASDVIVISARLTLRPFTFSNGVTIPADTYVALPINIIHSNEEIYPNAEEFDGFRFSKLRDEEGDVMVTRHQAIATSAEKLTFGIGRHACPGRFFAVNQMKALIAHIIVTYDFKFEEGKGVPPEHRFGLFRAPRDADVLFRERRK